MGTSVQPLGSAHSRGIGPRKRVAWQFVAILCVTLTTCPVTSAADLGAGLRAYNAGDYSAALKEWRPLADRGLAEAQFYLGIMYHNGVGVQRDFRLAMKWYRMAAVQGYPEAQNNLAVMYAKGEGVEVNPVEAAKWHRLAADQGDVMAECSVAEAYREGLGVEIDLKEAMKWYLKAAEAGHAGAQYNVGVMYSNGDGVPPDLNLAVKWYRTAAGQGFAPAQNATGNAYLLGSGVDRDPVEAIKWYRLAAEQGFAESQYYLAVMYGNGDGVSQDFEQALKWHRMAANRGYAAAQSYLGLAYEQGELVPQDYIQAHFWFNLARAMANRDRVARRMTQEQVAAAQALARNWKPSAEGPSASDRLTDNAPRLIATGSGFFISADGDVLTNNHVIEGCGSVTLADGGALQILASDAKNDLALLRSLKKISSVAIFLGVAPRLGETVVTFGFPLSGLLSSSGSVTSGTISSMAGPQDDLRLMQITAPVQPGNSGGPLLDLSGNVVGVIVAKLDALRIATTTGDIPQNVNFAVKTGVVRIFLDTNNVSYKTALSVRKLEVPEVAKRARQFTVAIDCWK